MLTANARKPFLEIARECNVSGAAVHQRIQRLTSSGVIRGFESLVDPSAVGYDTCAYVGVLLSTPTDVDKLVDKIREVPEVVEVIAPPASTISCSGYMPATTSICSASSATICSV